MLVTDTAQGPYPYAGIPWFSTVSAATGSSPRCRRCGSIPAIARGVLAISAATQATAVDAAADAEPGKILHEARHGEMADLGEVPFRRYYGSVNSTPLFVMLAGAYLERTGDVETARAAVAEHRGGAGLDRHLWRPRRRRLCRIRPPDQRRPRQPGLEGQPRIRSSMPTARWRTGPIALVEVQAYAYAAWRAADASPAATGPRRASGELRANAPSSCATLRRGVLRRGARHLCAGARRRQEALPRPRLQRRPCACSPASPRPSARQSVARTLSAAPSSRLGHPDLASSEARYNPMSYHNGSVWPHDNALIAAGLAATASSRGGARSSRACSPPRPISTCAGCRSCSAASRASRAGADLLSRRLLAAGLGRRGAAIADPVLPRPRLRLPVSTDRAARADVAAVPQRPGVAQARGRRRLRGYRAETVRTPRRRRRAGAPGTDQSGDDRLTATRRRGRSTNSARG